MKKILKQKLKLNREVVKSLDITALREVDGALMAKTNAGTCGGSRFQFMCQSQPEWACQIATT